MDEIVKAVVVEVSTVNTAADLNAKMIALAIDIDDFLTAVTISFEKRNNSAKIVIFYRGTE